MLLFDARYLRQPRSGIPRYALNLLRAVREADPGRRVTVLVPGGDALPADLAGHGPFEVVVDTNPPRNPREVWRWPGRLRRLKPSAVHCPDAYGPLRCGVPNLITIHDLIPLRCRDGLAKSRKQKILPLWTAWMKLQARRASAVVTVSEHSANDLSELLGVPRDRVHVIYNAVPGPEESASSLASDKSCDGKRSKPPYVLCVSRLDPYKNVPGLIDAFALLKAFNDGGPLIPHRLVIVGPPDPRYPQAQQRVQHHGLDADVNFTGAVSDEELEHLYRDAALLVMPSTYEGFGLPAVEAMHHGVPVVAADCAALPEVVGDAAVLVDPEQPAQLADAMRRVLADPAVADALIERGRRRVEAFAPRRIGERYLDLLDRLSTRRQ